MAAKKKTAKRSAAKKKTAKQTTRSRKHRASTIHAKLQNIRGNPTKRPIPNLPAMEAKFRWNEPLGPPPQHLTPRQREIWNEVRREMPWLAASNGAAVRTFCLEFSRVLDLEDFFTKRRKQLAAQGKPEAHAMLNDSETKQHPLMNTLSIWTGHMKRSVGELGCSPAAQIRIIAVLSKTLSDEHEESQDPALKFMR